MYRAPSKRAQLIKRTIVYSAMTTGVILLVTFLVFIMLGYRFNRDTSSIEQGGLVQFASRPDNAKVTIGKAELTDLTPSKITVNPGTYDVRMARDGYKPWAKNVDIRAGEVLWLNYAQLVPETVETIELTKFDTVAQAKSSPNGDRFALLTDASKPEITYVDITGATPRLTTLTIPTSVLPVDKVPSFTLSDWASDSDRMLVDMTFEGTTQRLVVDRREPNRTINLSTAYEADIAEVVFDPRSSERMIVRSSSGDLRTIDTAASAQSGVLATGVTSMSVYGNDAVLLVQALPENAQSVGYLSLGSDEVRELKRVDSAERTIVAASSYFSEPHVAIATGSKLDVYKLRSLPSSRSSDAISMTSVSSEILPGAVDHLSIRSSGRFVIAQYAGGVQTYDIELDKQTLTAFKAPVAEELRWLDRYHFYMTNGTDLEVMEFDGANQQRIASLSTTFDAVQSDNGEFIYSINRAADGTFAIQQSRMILE